MASLTTVEENVVEETKTEASSTAAPSAITLDEEIPTGGNATQGPFGTCSIYALTDVVQEQAQLRYGITIDSNQARVMLEQKTNMHNLANYNYGSTAASVAKHMCNMPFIVDSQRGCTCGLLVETSHYKNSFQDLLAHVQSNRGDSCAYVAIRTARGGGHAVAAYNCYTQDNGTQVVVCRNSHRNKRHIDVTAANYKSHDTVRVKMNFWRVGENSPKKTPTETPRY